MLQCILVAILLLDASGPRGANPARAMPAAAQKPAAAWSCPCSIWPNTTTPETPDAGPDRPVELGLRFHADVDGRVSGVRFYKSPRNTGVHVGNLWNGDGKLLASVVFSGETRSGWQTALFSAPVKIDAKLPYVVSYHSPGGHYAFSSGYFAKSGRRSGPLHALPGSEGPNGLFQYGDSSAFPTDTHESGNYWVDVLFEPRPAEPPAGPSGPSAEGQPAVKVLATTVKDFSTGTLSDVAITETDDGEVILAPYTGTDFIDGKVPQGWTSSAWQGGLLPKLDGGMARLDGARLAAALTFPPGRSLELVATFPSAANIHAGFAVSLTSPPWAIFSTGQGNALYARTNIGPTNVDTHLEGNWLGEPHRFRIDWEPKTIVFSIDGTEVATHAAPMTTRMRPIVSDLTPGGDAFDVDWIRMTPYAREGTFDSRIFDADVVVDWTTVYWLADEPAGTRVAVSVRGGNTPAPDSSWMPFTPVPTPGRAINRSFRYIQYRLELSTTERGQTPTVRELSINGTERAAR
jgi:hypothetical protein